MRKIFLSLVLSLVILLPAIAQKNATADKNKIVKEQAGRPDGPGDLFIEVGFNYLAHNKEWKDKFWGSKILNVMYQYDYNVNDSKISLHPGIGISTEKYAMDTSTLTYGEDLIGNRIVETINLREVRPEATEFTKSKIATTYLEIPLEIRWRSLKYDPKRSLKLSVGGKIGFLLDNKTKIKYEEYGEKKISKQNEQFEVRKVRYSVYGKLGYGNAYLFYNYNLSTLFETNKGPNQTEMTPMMFGFALSLF
jgi:hypothetical protein